MNDELKEQLTKISYLTRRALAAREASRYANHDYRKRVLARAVYLQVDTFIDLVRRFKNALKKRRLISRQQRKDLERRIRMLVPDFSGCYQSIRDKVTAHRQEETIELIFDYWNNIDNLSIDVFVDHMVAILQSLEVPLSFKFTQPDLEEVKKCIDDLNNSNASSPQPEVVMSNDSLALTRPGTVGMIACHTDQEKAQSLESIIDFLEVLSEVAMCMSHSQLFREVVWSLLIVDLFSFLDGLYDDGKHESLMTKWRSGNYNGFSLIEAAHKQRNTTLESRAREIRNKFAAHLDANDSLESIRKLVFGFDLVEFANYVAGHIENYRNACRVDIRTRMFLIRNVPLAGVVGVQDVEVKKFHE